MTGQRRRSKQEAVLRLAAAVLDYPGDDFGVEVWLEALSGRSHRQLVTAVQEWLAVPAAQRQQQYIRIFDFGGHSLYLTYLTHGETRQRGTALLEIKRELASGGLAITSGELPDYLPLLLEFAAIEERGRRLLADYRDALVRLADDLGDQEGPFGLVLKAVLAALPRSRTLLPIVEITDTDEMAVRR